MNHPFVRFANSVGQKPPQWQADVLVCLAEQVGGARGCTPPTGIYILIVVCMERAGQKSLAFRGETVFFRARFAVTI